MEVSKKGIEDSQRVGNFGARPNWPGPGISGRALFNHDAKLRQGVEEDDSSTMVEEGADPQWHQAGAGGRMQHLRKKKVMQRKRTRDLMSDTVVTGA